MLALTDDIGDKRKRALLIHTIGAEAQQISYTLLVDGDLYADVVQALKTFFMPKLLQMLQQKGTNFNRKINVSESQHLSLQPLYASLLLHVWDTVRRCDKRPNCGENNQC